MFMLYSMSNSENFICERADYFSIRANCEKRNIHLRHFSGWDNADISQKFLADVDTKFKKTA